MAFPLDEGDLFADRYKIIRCIASGGMGAVYEAVHTVTGRRCAIKVMLGHTAEREKLRERFMQESRVAAQIGSNHIVDVLDAGVDDKTQSPFLVMELLDGEDLGRRLVNLGRFSPEDTVLYLWHAALALDRTHQANIVHRDLKASNLFLTYREDGSPLVKILDFGVAKVMALEATSEGHTQTVGTPIYMAPEQFRAGGRISAATDIYALGMLAYTLLVGVHYWKKEHDEADNPFAFASLAVHGPTEAPTQRAARHGVELPRAFDGWFAKATHTVPQQRFATATQAVVGLASALGVPAPGPLPSSAQHHEPLSAPRQRLGSDEMPETVESESARVAPVSSVPTGNSDSFPALPPPPTPISAPALTPYSAASGSGGTEQPATINTGVHELSDHTEVSLSVTSGDLGLDESPVAAPAPKRSGAKRALTLGAVAIVLAGVSGVVWSKRAALGTSPPLLKNTAQPAASRPAPPPLTEPSIPLPPETDAPKATPAESTPAPADSRISEPSMPVTPLDELPSAEQEEEAASPSPPPRVSKRATRRRRSTPNAAPKAPEKPNISPSPVPRPPAATKDAPPVRREKLYGMD